MYIWWSPYYGHLLWTPIKLEQIGNFLIFNDTRTLYAVQVYYTWYIIPNICITYSQIEVDYINRTLIWSAIRRP